MRNSKVRILNTSAICCSGVIDGDTRVINIAVYSNDKEDDNDVWGYNDEVVYDDDGDYSIATADASDEISGLSGSSNIIRCIRN